MRFNIKSTFKDISFFSACCYCLRWWCVPPLLPLVCYVCLLNKRVSISNRRIGQTYTFIVKVCKASECKMWQFFLFSSWLCRQKWIGFQVKIDFNTWIIKRLKWQIDMCDLGLGNYSDNNSVSVQFKSIFISIITYHFNCVDFKKVVWSTRSL